MEFLMFTHKSKISSVLAFALAIGFATSHASEAYESPVYSFALWGDMPYAKANDNPKIPALIKDINASGVAFSLYDGDIKDGSSLCENSQYTNAISRFNTFKKPMVYIPGDNEWTDCHRTNNGGYNNLERLTHIRQTMANTPYSFGMKKMKLERQGLLAGEYAENVRFSYGKVMFVGLNVPGSNNNKVSSDECISSKSVRTLDDCKDDTAEYLARDAANISYLKESFQRAKTKEAKGLMVFIQADPGFDWPETETINERLLPAFSGYSNFLQALLDETGKFSGEVVLVHGDTHFFKIDKPLVDKLDKLLVEANLVKNFTRVETFGSPNAHWVKVSVNPYSRNLFTFEPMLVPGN
jgi:hypothetical protein